MRATEELLDVLVEQVYPQIAKRFGQNACILASSVAIDFLRQAGVACEAMACELLAMNERYYEMFKDGVTSKEKSEQAYDEGARCVAIVEQYPFNGEDTRPGYKGHVVVIVNREYLLDLTVSQVTREQKYIAAKPFYVRIPSLRQNAILKGKQEFVGSQVNDGIRTWFAYLLQPNRKDFRESPDWKNSAFRFTEYAT